MLRVRWLVLGSISLVAPLTACSGDDFTATPAGTAGNVGTGGLGGAAGNAGEGGASGGTAGSAGTGGASTGGNAGTGQAGATVGGAGGGPLPGGSAGATAAGASGSTSGSAGATNGGAAGTAGGAGAGGSGTTCGSQLLGLALKDKWDYQWDGNERTAAPLATAEAVCAGIGGRLPTASEVHRVSAGRTSQIGQVAFTQELWTNVPASPTAQITAKLSDGTTLATTLVTTPKVYRCVCAPPPSPGYGNDDCVGEDGPACATFQREGKTYAIDAVDRALLPFGAAEWECRFAGGSLPTPDIYVELTTRAMPSGIGSGKLLWHHTSDQSRGDQHMIFRWDADGTWKAAADTISTTAYATPLTGRCFGPKTLPARSTAAPANAHVVPETQQAFDAEDRAAVGINPALEKCFQAGGHLPSSLGLFDAITTRAPNGASAPLWTSDFTEIIAGAPSTSSTGLVGWAATAPRFALQNAPIGFIRGVKEGAAVHPYRCGYAPVDPSYAGPVSTNCSGACVKISSEVGAGAFWIDQLDRDTVPWPAAIRGCAEAGGRLASERDYFEAIRSGLGGGSNVPVWTSDISAHTVTPFAYAHTVKWLDVDPAYTDAFPARMSWSLLATPRPYRCAFTNEYR